MKQRRIIVRFAVFLSDGVHDRLARGVNHRPKDESPTSKPRPAASQPIWRRPCHSRNGPRATNLLRRCRCPPPPLEAGRRREDQASGPDTQEVNDIDATRRHSVRPVCGSRQSTPVPSTGRCRAGRSRKRTVPGPGEGRPLFESELLRRVTGCPSDSTRGRVDRHDGPGLRAADDQWPGQSQKVMSVGAASIGLPYSADVRVPEQCRFRRRGRPVRVARGSAGRVAVHSRYRAAVLEPGRRDVDHAVACAAACAFKDHSTARAFVPYNSRSIQQTCPSPGAGSSARQTIRLCCAAAHGARSVRDSAATPGGPSRGVNVTIRGRQTETKILRHRLPDQCRRVQLGAGIACPPQVERHHPSVSATSSRSSTING